MAAAAGRRLTEGFGVAPSTNKKHPLSTSTHSKHTHKTIQTLVLNWQGPVALLTSLDEYRRLGAGAPPHMTVTCYPELAESKGLVLVRGDVISGHVVSAPEARTLLQLARAFYTDPGAHRFVYAFNHEPEKFSFDALLAELGLLKSGQGGNKSASGGESGGGSGESGGGGDSGGGGGAGV